MKLTIYIGFDSRNFGQEMAYRVCRNSMVKNGCQVRIKQLVKKDLEKKGLFYREDDKLASTEFTYTRFLAPHLNEYQDWALFCDSDFLWNCNPEKILDVVRNELDFGGELKSGVPAKAVYCIQHDYTPKAKVKMNGLTQSAYPRKNWSSLMLFNCAHPSIKNLTVEAVNKQSPAWLHRMQWAQDTEIGQLPHTWNYLVGYYNDQELPKVIHYTDGGPWHPGYENCEFADLWWAYVTNPDERKRVENEREILRIEMGHRV